MKALISMTIASAMLTISCSTMEKDLDNILNPLFPEGEPGGAVLVMKGDKVLYDKGFGIADLVTGAGIDGETSFNIASCSKQFTAMAVLQLAEEGKLSPEDRIVDYFPEFLDHEGADSIWKEIRIKHLMSHSSGIPDARGYLTHEQRVYGDETLATEYLRTLDHLNFTPGTQYEYINPTFVLLGQLVERISGQEFTSYATEHLFTPSGMDRTVYFDRDHQELIPDMAHGYDSSTEGNDSHRDWYEYDFGEETFFATRPDGGIYSSTHELAKWEKALRSGKLLGKELQDEAWTAHTLVSGSRFSDYQNRPGTWYGYGWFLEKESEDSDPRCIYHTGDNGGFKALVARYPAQDALIVILANRADWDRNEVKVRMETVLGLR